MALVLTVLGSSSSSIAQETWQFRLSPYAWLAGMKGDLGTIPGSPAVPVDVSDSDALKDLVGGGMILLDARNQRHGFLVDLLYTDVRSDTVLLPAPIDLNLQSITKTTIATLAYQYELFRQDEAVVDVLAGLRYWRIDSELRFSGGLGTLAGRSIRNKESCRW